MSQILTRINVVPPEYTGNYFLIRCYHTVLLPFLGTLSHNESTVSSANQHTTPQFYIQAPPLQIHKYDSL